MIRHLTITLLVVDVILIGALVSLRQMDGAYRTRQAMPLGIAFTVDMAQVEFSPGRCILVRVTSDNCPHCDKDQRQYARLVAEAKQTKCSIVAVGPRVGDIGTPAADGTLSLNYIDFAFGRTLVPFLTPQTLIVDGSRRLVWQRQGALDDDDLGAASRVLATVR